jgi:hypothetical protein
MKFTKRILAALLTLTLALSLALPAAADNWSDFRITKQPQSKTIKYGDSFTLSVEVSFPAGVEVEYQWYRWTKDGSAYPITGATEISLLCGANDFDYPYKNDFYDYHCEIAAHEKDAGGNELSSEKRTSDRVRVTTNYVEEKAEKTFWDKAFDITLAPFGIAGGMTLVAITISFGLAIPFVPFIFLYYLIEGFVIGFRGLFL